MSIIPKTIWRCNNLKELWKKNPQQTELAFLNCKGTNIRKNRLRLEYKHALHIFDKMLRQPERQYLASKREYITNLQNK